MLTEEQRERYSRSLVVDEVGEEGQAQLLKSRVLVVGAGGLGSPVLLYLAAVGVGTLGVVDHDNVSLSNLQRQVVHSTSDLGRPKVLSARDRISALNPGVTVNVHRSRFAPHNALDLIDAYDVVVDATDSFGARYLLNDACLVAGRPLVHGAVMRFDGEVAVLCSPDGPCYRCVFREPPPAGAVPSPAAAGVISPLPGVIGTLQAVETVKLLLGRGEPLIGRMLLYDGWRGRFSEVRIGRDPRCPACGTGLPGIRPGDRLYGQ